MFNKMKSGFRDGIDTFIGSGTVFTGNLEAEGTVRIDGNVKGDTKVTGDVYVGDHALITGNIEAANVHLSGKIEGNITAGGILKILSTAKLYGDIKVTSFVADEGALFQGKCSMLEADPIEKPSDKNNSKKNYKKSSVLDEVYENKEKEKENEREKKK